jgi:hypothetical protein
MTAEGRIKFPPPAPVSPADPAPEVLAQLKSCPVAQGELPDGSTAWLVGGYEQVRQVLTDQRFSRALAVAPGRSLLGIELPAAGSIIAMDPEHTRLRKLVASAFTVRRVEALRPRVAAIVDELIGAFTARPQPTDLMTSFPCRCRCGSSANCSACPPPTWTSSSPGRARCSTTTPPSAAAGPARPRVTWPSSCTGHRPARSRPSARQPRPSARSPASGTTQSRPSADHRHRTASASRAAPGDLLEDGARYVGAWRRAGSVGAEDVNDEDQGVGALDPGL